MDENQNKTVTCEWCGWAGKKEETEPLGGIEEGDPNDFLRECPECGEPGPTPVDP